LIPSSQKIFFNKCVSKTAKQGKVQNQDRICAVDRLMEGKQKEEAEQSMHATLHCFRRTGISEDVKIRRNDAGHASSNVTDE